MHSSSPATGGALRHLGLILLASACGGATEAGDAPDPGGASALAVGASHACALSADGGVFCWGRGLEGQLGVGPELPEMRPPVAVSGTGNTFIAVAAGGSHTCALDRDGAAFCWGANDSGQLGVESSLIVRCGQLDCSPSPQPVAGGHRFTSVVAGHQFSCGLEADGGVWCWGAGDVGQLGRRVTEECNGLRCSRLPVEVEGGIRLRTLSAGRGHACGLDADGAAICWGYNYQGQLGRGDRIDSPVALPVVGGQRFRQVSAGGLHTCALTTRGSAFCWGIDALGAGTAVLASDEPVAVAGGGSYDRIEAARFTTCAIREDRLVECWGANLDSEVGVPSAGSTQRFDEPIRAAGDQRFGTIAGKYSTYCGVAEIGGIYCWGEGEEGQLGSGIEDSAVPVQVGQPADLTFR